MARCLLQLMPVRVVSPSTEISPAGVHLVKTSFRFSRILFVVIAMAVFATAAYADSSLDPTIVIRDPACPTPGCVSVGTNFTFGVPSSGSGTLFFTNGSGINWNNLKLTESGVSANVIGCTTTAFANCTVSTVGGVTTIFLSGINSNFLGITNGENFSIVFGCVGNSCWPGGLDFTATANVPEPGTMALLLTGIGGIISRRRWLNRPVS
jgi:PEP-CTERM motif